MVKRRIVMSQQNQPNQKPDQQNQGGQNKPGQQQQGGNPQQKPGQQSQQLLTGVAGRSRHGDARHGRRGGAGSRTFSCDPGSAGSGTSSTFITGGTLESFRTLALSGPAANTGSGKNSFIAFAKAIRAFGTRISVLCSDVKSPSTMMAEAAL
jgi:hypothetical protein